MRGNRPPMARAGVSGGILRNTGILDESDNLTGYSTLDPTAYDTLGRDGRRCDAKRSGRSIRRRISVPVTGV